MSDYEELPEVMRKTARLVDRLYHLFNDPQPGLMVWLSMTTQVAMELKAELGAAAGEKQGEPGPSCPLCRGALTLGRVNSSYSRYCGGWELACKPCHLSVYEADTEEQVYAKAAQGIRT
jgi:hypothetical protein